MNTVLNGEIIWQHIKRCSGLWVNEDGHMGHCWTCSPRLDEKDTQDGWEGGAVLYTWGGGSLGGDIMVHLIPFVVPAERSLLGRTMKRAPYVCVCVRASVNEKCYFSSISWPILILFVLSDRAGWGLQNFCTEFWNSLCKFMQIYSKSTKNATSLFLGRFWFCLFYLIGLGGGFKTSTQNFEIH